MIDKFNNALIEYGTKWQALADGRTHKAFFEGLKPTAFGWKVADHASYDAAVAELQPLCDQIHMAWLNERWLASMHLRDSTLLNGITTIKIMQVRPGSSDELGLDHTDFYSSDVNQSILVAEKDLKWTEEHNGNACKWLSIWFDGTEAKLRTDTVFAVGAAELLELDKEIKI